MRKSPIPSAPTVKYLVTYLVNPTNDERVKAERGERTVPVEVVDRGEEQLNISAAIIAGSFALDGEGIDSWDFIKCVRAS